MDAKTARRNPPERTFEVMVLAMIFLLSLLVKTHRIESGNYVVWDEAHFGKFSTSYLKREFYFDVHPPLGKLMTALSGLIWGQDTAFKFDSGNEYPHTVDYCGMRRFHAFLASFIPLLMYGTMRELGYSMRWCSLFSCFYVFENGMISVSRLILLDSHLLLFTSCVLYAFVRFARRQRGKRLNMVLLGTSIGLVLSVKWIGCFTTLFVGTYIVWELYMSLKHETLCVMLQKFTERALFLILVPAAIYVMWFVVHFAILVNSSTDEAHMSSLFQIKLRSNTPRVQAKYVEFGHSVTIKASKMTGGNLHSHPHAYPDGAGNQVTTYYHKDHNNEWAFQKVTEEKDNVDFLRNGDSVVLMHLATSRYLSTGDRPAFVAKHGTVAITVDGLTVASVWTVELVHDLLKREDRVKSITTTFKLFNAAKACYLAATPHTYPEWGFGQGEVVCTHAKDEGSVWNVEKNEHVSTANVEYREIFGLKNTFLLHFLEMNRAMLKVNSSFKQEEDLEPQAIVSRPYEWFILRRGMRMVHWDNDDKDKFYMFGNPFVWYLASFSVIASPLVLLAKVVWWRRAGGDTSALGDEFFEVFVCSVGWLYHYAPFFFIGRVLYHHHYFPAMLFAILSISYVMKHVPKAIFVGVAGAIVGFVMFSPLTYGFKSGKSVSYAKLLKSWDFA